MATEGYQSRDRSTSTTWRGARLRLRGPPFAARYWQSPSRIGRGEEGRSEVGQASIGGSRRERREKSRSCAGAGAGRGWWTRRKNRGTRGETRPTRRRASAAGNRSASGGRKEGQMQSRRLGRTVEVRERAREPNKSWLIEGEFAFRRWNGLAWLGPVWLDRSRSVVVVGEAVLTEYDNQGQIAADKQTLFSIPTFEFATLPSWQIWRASRGWKRTW